MSEENAVLALVDHLTGELLNLVARVDDTRPTWQVPGLNTTDPGFTYDVDDPATGPVVLVRRGDGVRFEVDVDVHVRQMDSAS